MVKTENVKGKMLNAVKWSLGAEMIAKLITPFTSMILARILTPDAFGIVATVTIIISLADMITDAGFSKYLVQNYFSNKTDFYKYANTAFWANICLSWLIWMVITLNASFFAALVGAEGYELAITVASFKLIITAFTSIQKAVYQRALDYKTMFVVRMTAALIPLVITIPLAMLGFDYWSLILASLLNETVYAIILTIKSEWKPRWYFNINYFKKMLPFSIWSLFEQFTIWLTTYADSFVISKYLNKYYLGLYKQPYQLVTNIYSVITASVFSILFSALSRFNDENDENGYKKILFDTQKLLAIVIVPMGFGIFIFRDFITKILLGNNWSEASLVIGCFALEKMVQVIINNSASEVYRSKGRPRLSALAQIIFLIVLIPSCIGSLKLGFKEFVIIRASMCIIFSLIHIILIGHTFKINLLMIFPKLTSIGISTAIMLLGIHELRKINSNSSIFNLFIIFVAIIIYGLALMLFSDTRQIIVKYIQSIKNKLRKVK